ncbi:MAG TPA: contractile injection system protein, VgrG/Pvc8 family [Polyangiaceae bacterium]|nr:contractile injection system protein, VgrG/Pvc8 family [Polyangiaceae bacterium]
MTLSRPRARVTLDGQALSSAEAALARVEVSLWLGARHDHAYVALWPDSRFADVAPGATLSIALGEDGAEEGVFSGTATRVTAGADGIEIDGLSLSAKLSKFRRSQTYVEQTVADIVRDLAGSVSVDSVAGDLKLASYSVDQRRSAWDHIVELATLTGADVASTASGALRFVRPRTGTPDVTLRYGADVLAWEIGPVVEPGVPKVAAHGAGSEAGSEQWHWVLASPPAQGNGDGPVDVVPAFTTRDAAEQLARARAEAGKRAAVSARLTTLGRHDLRPGSLVRVSDLPTGDAGVLRVLGVEHCLDSRTGFVTNVTAEGAG